MQLSCHIKAGVRNISGQLEQIVFAHRAHLGQSIVSDHVRPLIGLGFEVLEIYRNSLKAKQRRCLTLPCPQTTKPERVEITTGALQPRC